MIKSYKDLSVWKKSIDLVKQAHLLCSSFAGNEDDFLVSEIKRSSISVSSNIAQASNVKSVKDSMKFLDVASSSLAELDTQLFISVELGYISNKKYKMIENNIEEIGKILSGMRSSLNREKLFNEHDDELLEDTSSLH